MRFDNSFRDGESQSRSRSCTATVPVTIEDVGQILLADANTGILDQHLDILARHPIPARNVVAHSDVAPDRKQDPGELFDWEGLARNGVGLWPARDPTPPPEEATLPLLGAIGYRTDLALSVLVTAFQRHWLQHRTDGIADAETRARIAAVAALCG